MQASATTDDSHHRDNLSRFILFLKKELGFRFGEGTHWVTGGDSLLQKSEVKEVGERKEGDKRGW